MNTVNEPRKATPSPRIASPRGAWASHWAPELRILLVAVLLATYFQFVNHDFLFSNASLVNLSQYVAPVAIIAFGEIMLMIGGDIDLSAGMVFAFAPFMMVFASDAGAPMWLAVIAGLVAASIIGFVNGAVTVFLRLPSFVTTLGTLFLINGITLTVSRGTPAATPGSPEFAAVMGAWGYSEIIWTVAIAFVMHVLLRHTRWGLHTQAAGANGLGASEAGIRVNRLRLGNFVLAAVLAGFTGILESFRITSIDPQAGGNQIMFLAVAAAVIGGTPLTGGSGTIVGGLLGAAVLGILSDGFTLIGINAFTFNIILGAAILAAMIFNIHVGRIRRKGAR
ncbi:branched-chain amino acid transport system permease [Caballeronia fortuita]|uniref:Branched-chain amino acid transport system permease n=1 Tax=Caballeronia fortuita TaxID=1777138 RepID=A0A158AM96_9BURK|nr:ABC transporter permease [Caballeronia fortuita]SAK59081.1 branched-chain amino acid transport system permease [Caballeronia fortuita]